MAVGIGLVLFRLVFCVRPLKPVSSPSRLSDEFGFVRLPDSAATGSSMMPQKLNPDVAELARGKAGTAIGRLTGLLATVKGLPLAYNSDLGEDKPAAFGARRDVRRVLAALVVLIRDLRFDEARLETAASDPGLLATDAAEALVAEGIPFRDAHEQVAGAVREGAFDPDSSAAESAAARLGDVAQAVAEARKRFS